MTHIPDSFAFRVSIAGRADGAGARLLAATAASPTTCCRSIRPRRHAAVRGRLRSAGVDDADGIHLTAGEAARVAREAGAARLILTHILDREDRDAVLHAQRVPECRRRPV